MVDIIEYVKNVSLFKSLQEDELKLLSTRFTAHEYKEGETVLRELEKSTALYILVEGEVNVVLDTEGIEFVLDELRAGQFFGEMALLDGKPRSAGVICMSDCRMLKLSGKDFYEILDLNPSILQSLVVELCDRLRKANAKLKGDNSPQLLID
ncbi:MAG: cyclic nucleotide-binding domain-containing protein [Deltaproteobacteria bacterium]|nr:cyclic nucleotide-binding domain-containing protein [Deltaproteobacteria bacterium]